MTAIQIHKLSAFHTFGADAICTQKRFGLCWGSRGRNEIGGGGWLKLLMTAMKVKKATLFGRQRHRRC